MKKEKRKEKKNKNKLSLAINARLPLLGCAMTYHESLEEGQRA